jgi:hypothetical protein
MVLVVCIVALLSLFVVPTGGECYIQELCTQIGGVYSKNANTTTVFITPVDNCSHMCITLSSSGRSVCRPAPVPDYPFGFTSAGDSSGLSRISITCVHSNTLTSTTVDRLLYVRASDSPLENYAALSYPPDGSLATTRLEVIFSICNSSAVSEVWFQGQDFFEQSFPADTVYLDSPITDREIGTWFYEVSAGSVDHHTGRIVCGPAAHGYMEFVLTHEEISKHRYFQAEDASESVLHATNLNTSSEGDLDTSPGGNHRLTAETTRPGGSYGGLPQNICLFNGPKLDGQKQIWYQQSKHMDPARFHFIWLLAEGAAGDPTVHFIADLPHVSVGANPALPVAVAELAEAPADGSAPASELWAGNTTYLFLYAHQRLVAANCTVDEVTPVWCRRMYVTMREAMLRHSCEVVVYGNTRGFSSDVVVTDTARVLGIPLVAELLNLYMHELVLPDVVVAPSQFALQHHSMRKFTGGGDTGINCQVSGTEQLGQCPCTPPRTKSPEMVVIPPSIDTGRFSREMVLEHEIYHHPACKVHVSAVMRTGNESGHWPCVVIGFVARLSPGNCTRGSWLCRPFSHTLLPLREESRAVSADGARGAAAAPLCALHSGRRRGAARLPGGPGCAVADLLGRALRGLGGRRAAARAAGRPGHRGEPRPGAGDLLHRQRGGVEHGAAAGHLRRGRRGRVRGPAHTAAAGRAGTGPLGVRQRSSGTPGHPRGPDQRSAAPGTQPGAAAVAGPGR